MSCGPECVNLPGSGQHSHNYSGKAMMDILLSGLSDLDVQRQALVMKDVESRSFDETMAELLRLEVARVAAGVAVCGMVQGVVVP